MKGLLQDITIYHKTSDGYERYNVSGSFRNETYLNKNKTGSSNSDNALIRIFDIQGYNNTWKIQKGDIIVGKRVLDSIIKAPITELRDKYGEHNVFEVSSIAEFIFNDGNSRKIQHIKIGAR